MCRQHVLCLVWEGSSVTSSLGAAESFSSPFQLKDSPTTKVTEWKNWNSVSNSREDSDCMGKSIRKTKCAYRVSRTAISGEGGVRSELLYVGVYEARKGEDEGSKK